MRIYLLPVLLSLLPSCALRQHAAGKEKVPLQCTLTSAGLRERKNTLIAALKGKKLQKKELPEGYAYRFEASDENLDLLTEFIKAERQCCDFFNFSIHLRNTSELWLEITGPEGTKSFIRTELDM